MSGPTVCVRFFFNDTATTEIYTLSLHDALPICQWLDLLARSRDGRANHEPARVNYEPESADTKLRGGYYTPPDVASLLSNWALVSGEERVLEPSCGDGNFIEAALGRLHGRGFITGVELSPTEAGKALSRGGDRARIVFGDVFDWYSRRRASGVYDAVLGNPPFIRYQNFPEAHRQPAFDLMRSRGLNPSRLTNAWVPFVVLATDALKDGGRLGLVMPAELLQVGYAGEL